MEITFEQFLIEKNKFHSRRPKRKYPKRVEYEKPFWKELLDIRSPSQKTHHASGTRGTERKSLKLVPQKYNPVTRMDITPGTSNILKRAKKARGSYVKRITKNEVLEIATKYQFNVPDDKKPVKHLGPTGIKMVRKAPGVFYLVKV
jgi:hypothetical protein